MPLKLTTAQKALMPDTYGIPVNCNYTNSFHVTRTKQKPVYNLDFESITDELNAALDIGLENYGSGRANWIIPAILKAPNNANKLARYWQLYCSECANQHDSARIAKAWHSYTAEQREYINGILTESLKHCFDYLANNF